MAVHKLLVGITWPAQAKSDSNNQWLRLLTMDTETTGNQATYNDHTPITLAQWTYQSLVICHSPIHHILRASCLRSYPKMSTFSQVYKQYTFSKPPPFKVYRPTFLGSKMKVPPRTFIIQQQKITIFQGCLIYVTNDTGL